MEVGMRLQHLVLLFERKHAAIISQGVDDNGRILAGLDDLIQVADGARAHGQRQRAVVPDRAFGIEQIAAD